VTAAAGPAPAPPTPLARKLGIVAGSRVLVENLPGDAGALLGELPAGVRLGTRLRGCVDVVLIFVTTEKQLRALFPAATTRLQPAGGLWVAWPKRASRLHGDLGFATVQTVGLEAGLVDNKSCSVDADWQALRFVVRRRDRPPRDSGALDHHRRQQRPPGGRRLSR